MAYAPAGLSAQLGRLDCGRALDVAYLPEHETVDYGVRRSIEDDLRRSFETVRQIA